MRFILAIGSSLMLLFSCNNQPQGSKYSERTADDLTEKIINHEPLRESDYEQILLQLDGMLNEVIAKSQKAIGDGKATKTDIRQYLNSDTALVKIQEQSRILDSVLVNYVESSEPSYSFKKKYYIMVNKAYKRSSRVGLTH